MNKARRDNMAKAIAKIKEAKSILEDVSSEESDAMDGLEEHFSETERYAQMEANVDSIDEAVSSLEEALSSLDAIE